MFKRHQKPPYSSEELHSQISDIADLNSLRERTMQKATIERSDTKQQKLLEEVDRYVDMIAIAQSVYQFQIDAVQYWQERQKL